jgi:GntR family transcriptional regulator
LYTRVGVAEERWWVVVIDSASDRPVYRQIADQLRVLIRDGTYPPGTRLPSETELVEDHGVTRVTVRRGLALLEQEGLAEIIRGKGVFVRRQPPVIAVRTSRFSRAARMAGKGALAAEAEALGLTWRSEEIEVATVDLAPAVAEVLGEDRAVVKRRRMWVDEVPTQLADSYLPVSVDQRIGWSAGAQAPGGVYGLLEQHGHSIVRFREELVARPATPDEAVALHLAVGSPVVVLVRHAIDQDGRVVEYFDSVAAADKHRYVYEFEAPDE